MPLGSRTLRSRALRSRALRSRALRSRALRSRAVGGHALRSRTLRSRTVGSYALRGRAVGRRALEFVPWKVMRGRAQRPWEMRNNLRNTKILGDPKTHRQTFKIKIKVGRGQYTFSL